MRRGPCPQLLQPISGERAGHELFHGQPWCQVGWDRGTWAGICWGEWFNIVLGPCSQHGQAMGLCTKLGSVLPQRQNWSEMSPLGISGIQCFFWGHLWKSEHVSLGLRLKEIHFWPHHPLRPPSGSLQTHRLTVSGYDPRLDMMKCDCPSSYSTSFFFGFFVFKLIPSAFHLPF